MPAWNDAPASARAPAMLQTIRRTPRTPAPFGSVRWSRARQEPRGVSVRAVLANETADGIDGDCDAAIEPGFEARPRLDATAAGTHFLAQRQDAPGADSVQAADDEKRRRLHLDGENTRFAQALRARLRLRAEPRAGVVRVAGLDDADMMWCARRARRVSQSRRDIEIRDCRIFQIHVRARCAFRAHRGERDDRIAELRARADGTGRADADDRVDTRCAQLFDTDRDAGRTHAGGRDRHRDTVERAGHGTVLAVFRYELGGVEMFGDARNTLAIAGHEHVAPDLPRLDANMVSRVFRHARQCAARYRQRQSGGDGVT